MCVLRHSQSSQNSKFAMSLQYLLKEVMNGVHFGVHQDQNFYKLDYQFSVKTRHVQSTKKRKYVKFLQYIKKKYRNCFCVLFWCKTFRYVMFVVTCFWVIVAKKKMWPFRSWNSEICRISREWIDKMSWFFCMLIKI